MAIKINEISQKKLWEGCMLATISHAVMVGEYPELSSEHSWDGINYNIQDLAGCKGTITFFNDSFVGVFQSASHINIENYSLENVSELLKDADEDIVRIAKEEALQYVLEDVNGDVIPVISAVFWGIDNQIYGSFSYDEIMEKGGYILKNQLKSYEESMASWIEYYEMNDEQIALTKKLFDKKLAAGESEIILTGEERRILTELYEDNVEECIESLKEIDIIFK